MSDISLWPSSKTGIRIRNNIKLQPSGLLRMSEDLYEVALKLILCSQVHHHVCCWQAV